MPTLLKACARVGSDAPVAGAVKAELSNAAAGSRAVTAAVSIIRRDLLMARLPHGGRRCGAQPPSQRTAPRSAAPSQRAPLRRTALLTASGAGSAALPDPPAPGPALLADGLAAALAVTRPGGAFFQKISAFPRLQREICRAGPAAPGGRHGRTRPAEAHPAPPRAPPTMRGAAGHAGPRPPGMRAAAIALGGRNRPG